MGKGAHLALPCFTESGPECPWPYPVTPRRTLPTGRRLARRKNAPQPNATSQPARRPGNGCASPYGMT